MACILKLPTSAHRGVISFTTQERDRFIVGAPRVEQQVAALKRDWLIGLHHNWHDFSFRYNPLFDFSMAGTTDLIERDRRPFSLLPMDACNFSPGVFHPPAAGAEKMWDVLTVGRPAFFKRLPVFLDAIRGLYDRGHMLRVLCIVPLPPYQRSERKTIFYELEARYTAMFSADERKLFNLWTMRHDYPFPLDLTTLAHFYRASRVFVHTANDERRCRVAAYAWATALPVVAVDAVASLLSPELQREPFWFEVERDEQYPEAIARAVAATRQPLDFEPARREMSEEHTRSQLVAHLRALLAKEQPAAQAVTEADFALERLDIRLGRHFEFTHSANGVLLPLELFLDDVLGGRVTAQLAQSFRAPDPERELEKLLRGRYDTGRVQLRAQANRVRDLRNRATRLAEQLRTRARRYLDRL